METSPANEPIPRVRGSWKYDEKTGEMIECPRADAYAEMIEREARKVLKRPSVVKMD